MLFVLQPPLASLERIEGDAKSLIITGYQEEVYREAAKGGIRQPASVVCNKVRHCLTNYDVVRDIMTSHLKRTPLEHLELRAALGRRLHSFTVEVVYFELPTSIKLLDAVVTRTEIISANNRWWKRESESLLKEFDSLSWALRKCPRGYHTREALLSK